MTTRAAPPNYRKGIHYVDVGTSGGIWGLTVGYYLMIGGDNEPVQRLARSFKPWRRKMGGPIGHTVQATTSRWSTMASSTA